MKLNIKDNNGSQIKIGDTVQVLKFTNDSSNASDLFGVEPHLDGWVQIIYIESFEGVVKFDENRLMYVIKGKHRSLPLSVSVRDCIWSDIYDIMDRDDINEAVKDFGLKDNEYLTIIEYIKKIDRSI